MSNTPNEQFVDSLRSPSGDFTHDGATHGGTLGAQIGHVPVQGHSEPDSHWQTRKSAYDFEVERRNGS